MVCLLLNFHQTPTADAARLLYESYAMLTTFEFESSESQEGLKVGSVLLDKNQLHGIEFF